MSPSTFLTDIYADGAQGHLDAVGIHPDSYPDDIMDRSSSNTFDEMPTFHQIMVNNGDGAKQIWSTQFGIPTGTDTAGGAVSVQSQAQQLSEAFAQIKRWSWAGPLFYYNWQDGPDAATIDQNFGLDPTASGKAKLALGAFK